MRDTEIREVQSLERMDDFERPRTADFPRTGLGGQKFAEVKTLLTELHQLGEAQAAADGAAQASAEAKRRAKLSLQQKMRAMRETAKAMEPDEPGISDRFKLPTGRSEEALLNSARAFFSTATPRKAGFVAREMPETFLDDLSETINEFETAAGDLNLYTANRVSATAGIKSRLARAAKLRKEIDPIVRNKYRNDPASLAAWKSASRVERPPKKQKQSAPTQPPPQT